MKHENYEDKINQGCLHEMRCPWCFSAGPFNIACKTWVEMHDDGSEKHEDLNHDDDSNAQCLNHPCDWHGTVGNLHFAFEMIERIKSKAIPTGIPTISQATFDTFLRDVRRDHTLVADDFAVDLEKKNPILLKAITEIADTMGVVAEKDPEVNDARSNALLGAFCAAKILYNQDEIDQLEAVEES